MWQRKSRNTMNLYIRRFLAFLCICTMCMCLLPEQAKADAFSDSYEYYQTYGGEMTFHAGNDGTGVIYYGTRGPNASTASIRYGTVGWKVTVTNSVGTVIDTLYFKIGGKYITAVDHQIIDGYVYMLYACPLDKLKEALSDAGRAALKTANCNIVFDACMIVKLSGVAQGGIEDGGATWGTVYTTYDGIVNAKGWSDSSKTNLKSYFNKTVTGLFYNVNLAYEEGIASVSGAGKYCYGSEVTVSATLQPGYAFDSWSGTYSSDSQTYSFTMYDSDVSLTADGVKSTVTVKFYRNWNAVDTTSTTQVYSYWNTLWVWLIDCGWTKEGYHQLGWSTNRNDVSPMYAITERLNRAWYDTYFPSTNLYAIWEPNSYVVKFNKSGGTGQIANRNVSYTDVIQLPSSGFSKTGATLAGWSLYKNDTYVEYQCGETVLVSDLVEEMGLGYKDGATITLYAVWDNPPIIHGSNLYVTLEDARNGVITEEWIGETVYATDDEDGEISYGYHGNNELYLMDYSPTDFTGFSKEGYVTETIYVSDSAGNLAKLQIKIHIVDNQVYEKNELQGQTRFISQEYYQTEDGEWIAPDDGGLWNNSIWRIEESYQKVLDELFAP